MELSKAFDTVPHRRFMQKIKSIALTLNFKQCKVWIGIFLCYRKQRVIVDGQVSEFLHAISRVQQGTVSGAIFFLIYINDFPDNWIHWFDLCH